MSLNTYSIERFIGLNQSVDENSLSPAYSPDAVNMDTSNGNLSVARGCAKYISSPLPSSGAIDRLFNFRSASGDMPVVLSAGKLYAYKNGAWALIHNYIEYSSTTRYDAITLRIGLTDYLVIADGRHQLLKFDGETATVFGSEAGCSNIPVTYLTMYRGRLFSAGDSDNPNRLYYSVLPGGDRTLENWGYIEASPNVEGGHIEIGSTGGDPIRALYALSNQLLIFKKHSIYRLIGDRPSNFTVELICSGVTAASHTAMAASGDVLYFVTEDGLYIYNGVSVKPSPDIRMIKDIMAQADVAACRAAVVKDMLYFTFKHASEDAMIEYSISERKYMLRKGFTLSDIMSAGDRLLLINDSRYILEWGVGSTYDGEPIDAYWKTPLTDFRDKASIKTLRELYLRGTANTVRSALLVDTSAGLNESTYRFLLPVCEEEVLEIPLSSEGRCVRFKFYNEAGGGFTLMGGIEITVGIRSRVS